MARRPDVIEFHEDDRSGVLAHMAELLTAPGGWLNLRPGVEHNDAPVTRSPMFGIFSGRGPELPIATWMPGTAPTGQPPGATSVGLRHGTGPRVVERLRSLGLALPDGWRVLEDHPRRGLVVAVPADDRADDVLDWLLRAAALLCPVPPTGWWLAEVYPPD